MTVDGSALVLLAGLLLTVPLPWVGAALAAAGFHEACHWAVLRGFHVKIHSLRIGAGGAVMETATMPNSRELLAALAGPAGSLSLLALARWCPRLAVCGGIQGLFNLLPVWPMDGGRALVCLLKFRYSEEKTEHIRRICENTALGAILLGGIALSFVYFMGIAPVLIAVTMVMKAKMRNTPCQVPLQRVQ